MTGGDFMINKRVKKKKAAVKKSATTQRVNKLLNNKKRRTRMGGFIPVSAEKLSSRERDSLVKAGWRFFEADGVLMTVPRRRTAPPLDAEHEAKRARIPAGTRWRLPVKDLALEMPRKSWGIDDSDKKNPKRIEIFAWPFDSMTVSDIDSINDAPASINNEKGVFAYMITDDGVHIYQNGKRRKIKNSDPTYERISKFNRGWYGDRLSGKRFSSDKRLLVTTDADIAKKWEEAGGASRLVSDINKSYIASVGRAKKEGTKTQKKVARMSERYDKALRKRGLDI